MDASELHYEGIGTRRGEVTRSEFAVAQILDPQRRQWEPTGSGCRRRGPTDGPQVAVTFADVVEERRFGGKSVTRTRPQNRVHHIDAVPLVLAWLRPEECSRSRCEKGTDLGLLPRRKRRRGHEAEETPG